MNKNSLLVSVIVTTKNEEDVVGRLLKSLRHQTYKDIEIVVVDNNSIDRTKNIAALYTNRIFNFGPERSAQRNYGARKARGSYLLFLDADMELTPDVVIECIKTVKSDDGIKAIVIPEESIANSFWERVKAFERSFYNDKGDSATDAARFFTREAFFRIGGYDEKITGPEDWDLSESIKEIGYKLVRIKSKIFHYERIRSLFSLAKKKYYYGLKSYRYLEKNQISRFSPRTIYFIRPVFYKNWHKLVANPILTIAVIIMLTFEQVGGAIGYIKGKATNE